MMFCPGCGADLDDTPLDEPCPGCEGSRRSAVARAQTAKAKAMVHDPDVVTESHYPDGTSDIVFSSQGRRSVSEIRSDELTQSYDWHSEGNANELDALHRLRDTLNERSENRPWKGECARELPDDRVVDGWLVPKTAPADHECDDGPPPGALRCQVVRVEQDLRSQRAEGEVTAHVPYRDLVEAVVKAVEGKDVYPDPNVVLVLDANDAPAFTHNPALLVDVRIELELRSLGSGWKEIWLVGPTTRLTGQIR